MKLKKKIVLAYSGGLDTSIILKWLQNWKRHVGHPNISHETLLKYLQRWKRHCRNPNLSHGTLLKYLQRMERHIGHPNIPHETLLECIHNRKRHVGNTAMTSAVAKALLGDIFVLISQPYSPRPITNKKFSNSEVQNSKSEIHEPSRRIRSR